MRPNSTDPILGHKVHEYLVSMQKETPYHLVRGFPRAASETRFRKIMEALGCDLTDDSLKDTPRRVIKMYRDELFYGLDYANFPKCTTIINHMHVDEMVLERGIAVKSFCEHHFLPIYGVAHVAYIPRGVVLGLSKMNRVVDFFSRRPQVQERLTEQVAYALKCILQTEDVAVIIKAQHFCVKLRGIEDVNCDTVTSKLLGRFRQAEPRAEFLQLSGVHNHHP